MLAHLAWFTNPAPKRVIVDCGETAAPLLRRASFAADLPAWAVFCFFVYSVQNSVSKYNNTPHQKYNKILNKGSYLKRTKCESMNIKTVDGT
jgi:hypothetical protein